MKKIIAAALTVLCSAVLLIPQAQAQSGNTRERMKKRIPQIVELKKAGIAGENEKGYLEIVPKAKASENDQKVIKAENEDRKTVYQFIAKKEKVTPESVAARRAEKIRQNSRSGEYYQKNGAWLKK